ncbi:MAG: ABC transporter ATPase [Flavobacteriaceae bacterium]|nr:ABC transporter ATPase [Flavobacteriaceae bacterium]
MFVPFNTLPETSKLWVYQANNAFSEDQLTIIDALLEKFINQWQRHGADLESSYKIVYNQFIVIAVNDTVSGCSIDASVHVIQEIEKHFNVELTNKLQVAFRSDTNINTVSLADFKKYIALNKISKHTIVFNNMVDTIGTFQTQWEVPANQSWHNKYFK